MSIAVPVSVVDIGEEEIGAVTAVLRSGQLAQGPVVEQFEQAFAAAHGTRHAVAVSSGTTALVASMQALALRPGDEVITSPLTFAATLNALLESGVTARFADVGDEYCIDPSSVEALIGPRTAAIMPVHLYGLPADMPAIATIAARHQLALVEDAAQAHGAMVAGRPVGGWGLGCFSFYGTKNLTAGEGGIVTTDSDEHATRLRLLRNQGMRTRYKYELPGHNYRMTDMQAALVLPQLRRIDSITARRRRNAEALTVGLAHVSDLRLPACPEGRGHVFHQYTVAVGKNSKVDRQGLAQELAARNIGSGIYYPSLVHDHDCYRHRSDVVIDHTPRAASAAGEVLSLPVHQRVTSEQLDHVIACTTEVLT